MTLFVLSTLFLKVLLFSPPSPIGLSNISRLAVCQWKDSLKVRVLVFYLTGTSQMCPLFYDLVSVYLWCKHVTSVTVHSLKLDSIQFDTWKIGNCRIPRHQIWGSKITENKIDTENSERRVQRWSFKQLSGMNASWKQISTCIYHIWQLLFIWHFKPKHCEWAEGQSLKKGQTPSTVYLLARWHNLGLFIWLWG